MGPKYEMVALIQDNFVRRTDVSSRTFDIYNSYLHVYALIITTSTRTYIKTTACEHHHFVLLLVEQQIFTSFLSQDIPGQARPTLNTKL